MPLGRGVKYKVHTYASGRRMRIAIIGNQIVERISMPRVRMTKSRKRLARKKRRLGL